MPTSNTALRVAELDFFSIRDNLKNYLRSQSEFTDYDFEGSGMAVLLDVLAYNTYYNGFYLNMAANEAFLDTAQLRQSVLSHAKSINYVPASSRGAVSRVNIKVKPEGTEPVQSSLTLEKYTRLLGRDKDGTNYPFVTINSNTVSKSADSYSFSNVFIKQGEVVTNQFIMSANNTSRRFEIPSANVDTSTMLVTVQESSSNTYTREYLPSTSIVDLKSDSPVYFVEENENLQYTVYFGDNYIGKSPSVGNIINVTYLNTVGAISNNISSFAFTQKVGGIYSNNVKVTTVDASYGGVNKETVDQIRFRAPQYYTSQNRAVTVNDYESILAKKYNNIDAVSIWGGEDNDPPVYGKVYVSIKTKGYYSLTNLEKDYIKNDLISNYNVLTVTPEIVDPNYIFIQIRGKVSFKPELTSKSSNEILSVVKSAISNYTNAELNSFKSTFRKSKLNYYIENADPSITGADISVYLQSRQLITLDLSKKYIIQFNTPLSKGTFTQKLFTYPQITLRDAAGTSRNVFIEEVPESFTGVDNIDVLNSGIKYPDSTTVTITGDGIGATAVPRIINGKIVTIEVTNRGTGYTRAFVEFNNSGLGSEAVAVPRLQAKNGTLRSFYYKDNGEKIISNDEIGTINYDTGEITIGTIKPTAVIENDYYDTNILTINTVPEGEIIPPVRNRILTIDSDNSQSIQIEIVAETQ